MSRHRSVVAILKFMNVFRNKELQRAKRASPSMGVADDQGQGQEGDGEPAGSTSLKSITE